MQMTRAVGYSSLSHGSSAKVERSGIKNMSDSAIRVNPAIEEPSIHWPPSMTCSNIDDGMVTLLTWPMTSVNCRSTNSTPSSCTRLRTSRLLGVSPRICLCSLELPIASATAATIDRTFLPPHHSPPAVRTGTHREDCTHPPSETV